jgi:hypothetical protein
LEFNTQIRKITFLTGKKYKFHHWGNSIVYLAEYTIKGIKRYVIRDSLYDPGSNCWQSRDLYDLGRSPWDYIKYPGGNSFYIDERVSEKIAEKGIEFDLCELEELLWKFITREIRQKLEPFHCRGQRLGRKKAEKKGDPGEQLIQDFDKRRIYYLRCGVVDQGSIGRLPLKYFKPLLNKSRDEIEQYLMQLEKSLNPREYKQYVYVVFDLQRHFAGLSARLIPQALDQKKLDKNFIKDLCRLHRDELFWAGFHRQNLLHGYLVRYAVMFFDYEFDGGSGWEEYIRNYINSKRFYRATTPKVGVEMSEIVEIFGVEEKELQAMNKSDLTKLFRRKAHEFHPDKGGEHDSFVKLAEAYKELLRNKS